LALTSSAAIITIFLAKNNSNENAFAQALTINTEQSVIKATGSETQTSTQTYTTNILATPIAVAPIAVAHKTSATKMNEAVAHRYKAVSDNPQYPTIEERVIALEQLYPEQQIDPEKVVDALSQPTAWKESAPAGKELLLSDKHANDGREFIEFDRERIAVMLAGDKIELPINDLGGAVHVVIDSVINEDSNTLTWNGHVEGAKEFMRVTITQGDGISVGLIETEKGSYTLQSNDNKGWIASNTVLMQHDPIDGLVPDEEHSTPDHHH
jgi:hypothetical protein